MRTIIFALLIFVIPLTPPPHMDDFPPIAPAATDAQYRWPLVCSSSLRDTVQFKWITTPDEAIDRAAIEARLYVIAEQVNWLFWRDSNSFTEARLPAWKVTADCRLDVRFDNTVPSGTIPRDGATKLIAIEPDDSYCGFAFLVSDNRPAKDNAHNASSFAAVSRQCLSARVVAHELLHMVGAVQPDAPHGTQDFHSRQSDIMGMVDADLCGNRDTIDCENDDYFSLQPTGYLAERWNSADSIFLVSVWKQTTWVPIAGRYE